MTSEIIWTLNSQEYHVYVGTSGGQGLVFSLYEKRFARCKVVENQKSTEFSKIGNAPNDVKMTINI